MDVGLFVTGFVFGLSIAAPVGPIAVLCIRRTLADGRLYGLISGLGTATADAVYGCVVGLGVTFVSDFLVSQQLWLRLLGGGFLCLLGAQAFLSKPPMQESSAAKRGLVSAYVSTFVLTLTNPLTVFSFVAIFAGFGAVGSGVGYASSLVLVLGVFLGSLMWWFVLSWMVSLVRSRFTAYWMRWINIFSGTIILGFGLVVLLSLVL